jgi:predicted TIM-barrel fold metal-dependent hydrolase
VTLARLVFRDTLKVLDSLTLTKEEREKIYWRNALELFGLGT